MGAIRSVAVSSNERIGLTSSRDKTVKLWALDLDVGAMSATAGQPVVFGECRQTYSSHRKGILQASWFIGERTIVSADPHAVHVRPQFWNVGARVARRS